MTNQKLDFTLDLEDDVEEFDHQESFDDIDLPTISNYSSEELCNLIIAFRTLGVAKSAAIVAMEELAKRRLNGEIFNFEQYISDEVAKMPKLDINYSSIIPMPLNIFSKPSK